MSKIIAWLKNIRPIKILTVLCMGALLIVTQACGAVNAGEPKAGANSEIAVPKGDKVLNPYEGGMNKFGDTDPRAKEVKAKAEALKQSAEQNLLDKKGTLGEDTPDLAKNFQQSAEDAKDKIGNNAEDFAKGVQRGVENIKDNAQDAVGDLTTNAQRAV